MHVNHPSSATAEARINLDIFLSPSSHANNYPDGDLSDNDTSSTFSVPAALPPSVTSGRSLTTTETTICKTPSSAQSASTKPPTQSLAASSAAIRRAAFHASAQTSAAASIERCRQSSSIGVAAVGKPALVRAMSAPIRNNNHTQSEGSAVQLVKRRLLRRANRRLPVDGAGDQQQQQQQQLRHLRIQLSGGAQTNGESAAIVDIISTAGPNAGRQRARPSTADAKRSAMPFVSRNDVVTLVSLLSSSSCGSDSECPSGDDEGCSADKPDVGTDASATVRAPSLRRTGKSGLYTFRKEAWRLASKRLAYALQLSFAQFLSRKPDMIVPHYRNKMTIFREISVATRLHR